MSELTEIEAKFERKLREYNEELPKKYISGDVSKNCAMLTMEGFLDIIAIKDQNLINMAAPLASIAGACGAVNAGLMIVGFIIGKQGKKQVHQLTAAAEGMKFTKRFYKHFGSCNCKTLTGGYDLLTRDGMESYIRDKIWEKKCYKHVVIALEIIGELYSKQIIRLL